MMLSYLFQSWTQSISLLIPSNFMPFIKQSCQLFNVSLKNFLSLFRWLVIIDFVVAIVMLNSNTLFIKNNMNLLISYFVLMIFFTIFIRQDQLKQITRRDYIRDLWDFILWCIGSLCALTLLTTLMIVVILPVANMLYYLAIHWKKDPLTPFQSILSIFGIIQWVILIFILCYNFILFYWLDSQRSLKDLWQSSTSGFKLLFLNIPLFIILVTTLLGCFWLFSYFTLSLGINAKNTILEHVRVHYKNIPTAVFFIIFMIMRYLNVLIGFFIINMFYAFYQKEKVAKTPSE